MRYKSKMHPTTSKAELTLFQALSSRGLTQGITTQDTIILKATKPDFLWSERKLAVYLDGDACHEIGSEWDQEVDATLEKRGYTVLRLRYHAPLTQKRLEEIIAEIKKALNQ